MEMLSLDPAVPILSQLDGGAQGVVTFVALFHVPESDAPKLLDAWYGEEEFLKRQPGFISRELVRGRAGSDVFIDYTKFENAALYKQSLLHPEHQRLLQAYGPIKGSSSLHLLDPTVKP